VQAAQSLTLKLEKLKLKLLQKIHAALLLVVAEGEAAVEKERSAAAVTVA
jgi:hypothetical protein